MMFYGIGLQKNLEMLIAYQKINLYSTGMIIQGEILGILLHARLLRSGRKGHLGVRKFQMHVAIFCELL